MIALKLVKLQNRASSYYTGFLEKSIAFN